MQLEIQTFWRTTTNWLNQYIRFIICSLPFVLYLCLTGELWLCICFVHFLCLFFFVCLLVCLFSVFEAYNLGFNFPFYFLRYDMANPRSGFFHGLLTRPSRILSISGKRDYAICFLVIFLILLAPLKRCWEQLCTEKLLWSFRVEDDLYKLSFST